MAVLAQSRRFPRPLFSTSLPQSHNVHFCLLTHQALTSLFMMLREEWSREFHDAIRDAQTAVGSAADNASSNGPLNKSIAKRCAKINPDTSSARNIQIGCGGHVTNIVAQEITGSLGMSLAVQDLDMYKESPDPVVIVEMELMAQEETKLASYVEERGSDEDDSSDTESESDSDDEWVEVDDSRRKPPKGKGSKPKKPKKAFTPVDKIHNVAIHILRSEIRRKRVRQLICRKVDKKYRHLVLSEA
ncbi:hypothetical protein B0H14DRAFT_2618814 [Mycena olivaceomarginata]|nr:hypothetical protein B0H14DRAFT_2618814 [Mycena olivaceomarginata]